MDGRKRSSKLSLRKKNKSKVEPRPRQEFTDFIIQFPDCERGAPAQDVGKQKSFDGELCPESRPCLGGNKRRTEDNDQKLSERKKLRESNYCGKGKQLPGNQKKRKNADVKTSNYKSKKGKALGNQAKKVARGSQKSYIK